MKKILGILLVLVFANSAFATLPPNPDGGKKASAKKETPAKKEVKKHKKFDGEKVEGTKPDTPTKKK